MPTRWERVVDMRSNHNVHFELTTNDRHQVEQMLRKGQEPIRVLRRALILLRLGEGQRIEDLATHMGVSRETIRTVSRRYEDEGLSSALCVKPRPNTLRCLDTGESQRIISMASGPPPAGMARWSVRLIATEAVKRNLTPQVSRETIRLLLLSREPRRAGSVVSRRNQ